MKGKLTILILLVFMTLNGRGGVAQTPDSSITFDFCGNQLTFHFDTSRMARYDGLPSSEAISSFCVQLEKGDNQSMVNALRDYRETHRPDDWLYYQLIRKLVQQISPKAANYNQYTLYKWWLLGKSGYRTLLTINSNQMLFYVQSDEDIYEIPTRTKDGKQYVCLNYHDYHNIDFRKNKFMEVAESTSEGEKGFSYKVTQLPEFRSSDYIEKDLSFHYSENEYHFKVKINPQVQALFTNYPVTSYGAYFNLPLSHETYQSLIPALKKNVRKLSTKNGVDYLMHFTRYAFLFEADAKHFGSEKRLTAEQTLFYDQSDCEDRVALFFYLVKEIYNLPMIVLAYPKHVTIAVQFKKPIGKPIYYNGNQYSICEPTPQKQDLGIGQMLPSLKKVSYEVAYTYTP